MFWDHVYASATRPRRCPRPPARKRRRDVCTACSPHVAALCECAMAVKARPPRRGLWQQLVPGSVESGALLQRSFNAHAARQCCFRAYNLSVQEAWRRPRRASRGAGERVALRFPPQ